LEIAESNHYKKRSSRGEADSPFDVGMDDYVSDRKESISEVADDCEDIMETIKSCYEPPSQEDYKSIENGRKKRDYGRSNVNHDEFEEQASNYERDAMVNSFGLTKVNDREPKKSKKGMLC
jgi:hypothetical protein